MPGNYDLLYALSLKPEEAVRYFESKQKYKFSFDWREVWQEAHNKAFTVAKMLKLDLLKDTREITSKYIAGEYDYKTAAALLEEGMRKAGWWGKTQAKNVPGVDVSKLEDPEKEIQLGSHRRIKTILETNNNTSLSAGRYRQMLANVKERPYWQYVQIDRPTKRETHSKLHLKVFCWDDPVWDVIWPPNGWGCKCYVKSLSKKEFLSSGQKLSAGEDIEFFPDSSWDFHPAKTFKFTNNYNNFFPPAEERPVKTEKPAGIPVSKSITVKCKYGLGRSIKQAIKYIDSIHGDGKLPLLDISPRILPAGVGGVFGIPPGNPAFISISPDGDYPGFSTLHELGHFIDYFGIGKAGSFASLSDPLMEEWRNAVFNSASYNAMQEGINTGKISMKDIFNNDVIYEMGKDEIEYLKYNLSLHEIFARSYSQYIAINSNSRLLTKALNEQRIPIKPFSFRHWQDSDFIEIEKALDNIFKILKWRK